VTKGVKCTVDSVLKRHTHLQLSGQLGLKRRRRINQLILDYNICWLNISSNELYIECAAQFWASEEIYELEWYERIYNELETTELRLRKVKKEGAALIKFGVNESGYDGAISWSVESVSYPSKIAKQDLETKEIWSDIQSVESKITSR